MPFFTIISSAARELLNTILFDLKYLPVYIIMIFLIKSRYERYMEFERNIYGRTRKTAREMLEETILFGLLAGFAGGVVTLGMGIVIAPEVFNYLFIIIAILSIVNIRYVCLSYAAGILILAGFFIKQVKVDITALLALVAVMHFIESIVMYFFSGKDSVPVFIRHREGITGAFLTQRFLPVPVVFFTYLGTNMSDALHSIVVSGKWPFFRPESLLTGTLALGFDCIIFILGYTDIAVTRQPEVKGRETALQFMGYSVVLFIIALLSTRMHALKIAGALFMPLAHEGIVLFGYYREKLGTPLFKPVKRGFKVFDMMPDSHAVKMGLKRGDTILNVNGKGIQTEDGLAEALKDFPTFVWVDIADTSGQKKTLEYKCYPHGLNNLGIIGVPREKEITYNIDYFENLVIIKNLVARFRGLNRPL